MPPQQHSEVMTTRITPGPVTAQPAAVGMQLAPAGRPPFVIVIPDDEGHELVRLAEENGRLVITGDEDRWDEGARRFLHGLMMWSGQVGINWRQEVLREMEGK